MSWAEPAVARDASMDGPQQRHAATDTAFERFFLDGHVSVTRFLNGLCSDRDLVEDATQEAFIIARAKWETIRDYDKPLLWVRKVARHELTKLIRRENRQTTVGLDEIPAQKMAEPADPWEARQEILELLRRLPQRQAAVLALAMDGCSDEEIGWELDLAINTVRSYKSSARQRLQRLLTEVGPGEGWRAGRRG